MEIFKEGDPMLDRIVHQTMLNDELKFMKSSRFRNGYIWDVEKLRQPFEVCPHCANKTNTRNGRAQSIVQEEPFGGVPLWLRIHKHKYLCRNCKRTFTESVKGVFFRRRTSQRFRSFLLNQCQDFTSLKRVTERFNVSSGFIHKLFYEQVQLKLRERTGSYWPKKLGIDEHFFSRRKGYTEFVTVFVNLNKNRLFEVAEGKSKNFLIEQIKHIPGRENVKLVSIDMCSPYRQLVYELFPNAKIITDKFHVVRMGLPYLLKERAQIEGPRKSLGSRKLLLKNRNKLDYSSRSKIDRYLKPYPRLDELYRAKEELNTLYRTKGKNRATQALLRIIKKFKKSEAEEIKRMGRSLENWREEILNYFEFKLTNAATEAINGRAKLLQKCASGYRSFKNYRLALLNACSY